MKLFVTKATTSKTMLIFIPDSSSTTGAGKTGLVWNTASLSWFFYREGAGTEATAVSLATMTLGTWATGGFVELDASDMPGWYEIGVPDAVLATGVDFVGMQLKGAANMAPVNIEIQLTNFDVNDASPTVTLKDGAHGGAAAVLTLERMIVASTTATEPAVKLTGNTTGDGLKCAGGTGGAGINAIGGGISGAGIRVRASDDALSVEATGSNGNGIAVLGVGSGAGIVTTGGATGDGLKCVGGATSGDGLSATAAAEGHGIDATGAGAGDSINVPQGIDGDLEGNVTGSVGSVTGGATAAALATVDAIADAIVAVTANLPNSGALNDLASILTDTAVIGAAGVGLTNLGGMSTGMKGEVNAEVVDVLKTDTVTLPGQTAPPLAPTFEQMLAWLYKFLRNRNDTTATLFRLYADNESTVDAKATVSSDGTTAIRQEIVSGP